MEALLGIVSIVFIFGIAIACGSSGMSQGKTIATDAICKQAYTAKVHEQIPICKEWKLRIDTELNDKLGVNNDNKSGVK